MCLGNYQDNFQLHRFTRRENTAKSFRGATFLTHTVDLPWGWQQQDIINKKHYNSLQLPVPLFIHIHFHLHKASNSQCQRHEHRYLYIISNSNGQDTSSINNKCIYSQLSISKEQICLSMGKYVRSMEQLAVTVSLYIIHQALINSDLNLLSSR